MRKADPLPASSTDGVTSPLLGRSQPPLLSDMVMALLEHDPGTRQGE